MFYLITNSNLNSQRIKGPYEVVSYLPQSPFYNLNVPLGILVLITSLTSIYTVLEICPPYLYFEFLLYWFCSLLLLIDISLQLLNLNFLKFLPSSSFPVFSARILFTSLLTTILHTLFQKDMYAYWKVKAHFNKIYLFSLDLNHFHKCAFSLSPKNSALLILYYWIFWSILIVCSFFKYIWSFLINGRRGQWW